MGKQTTAVPKLSDVLKQVVVFDDAQVTAAWQASDLGKLQLISTNAKYRALPKATWDAILATHFTLHPYTPDFFDCDAFSAVFVGYVLWHYQVNGVARVFDISSSHSYNAILICDDGETCRWEKVEPQQDALVPDSPKLKLQSTETTSLYAATQGFAVTA